MRACMVEGCGRPHYGRDLCKPHYNRLTRHGSPTAGGAPRCSPGEPEAWLNAHADYEGDECLFWPFKRNCRDGRAAWTGRNVARAMCEAAHGPPPSPEHHAAHSCGKANDGCINPSHLRWATPVENAADKWGHGTAAARLTEEQAREILRRYRPTRSGTGHTHANSASVLADEFGVSANTILHIATSKTWKHLRDADPRGPRP